MNNSIIVARSSAAGAALAVMGAGVLLFSQDASAAACDTVPARNPGPGSVCIDRDPQGYRALFHKTGGPNATADFNLFCANERWFGDRGAFRAVAGNTYTYVFSVGSQGSCQVRLLNSAGTVVGSSPYLSR